MVVLKNAVRVALLIFVITTQVMAAPSRNETLPGKPLTDLGVFLNKPHVVLAGKVINNLARKLSDDFESRIGNVDKDLKSQIGNVDKDLESRIDNVEKDFRSEMTDVAKEICRLHPCTEWGKWNNCSYTFLKGYGYFGKQNRIRICGFNTTLCKQFSTDQNIEVESRTCNKCREDYTLTKLGHCVKFVNIKYTRSIAANRCQTDGGNLIHIDSKMKFQDVITYVKERNIHPVFWIDGVRATANSKWEFTKQPEDPYFNHWFPGRPFNELCLEFTNTDSSGSRKYYLYDLECSETRAFMCEVYS